MLPGFRPEARLPAHARQAPGLLHDQSTQASEVTPSRRGERGEPQSPYAAGVSSELALRAGYFGDGASARDLSV